MNIDETRQLGIEFERRVQTMIPEREFLNKLDTETIYSFLNQYQDKYIHDIYRSLDNIPSGSKLSAHVESILQSLIGTYTVKVNGENNDKIVDNNNIIIVDTARSFTFKLPENYYMYIRSVSNINSTYSYKNYTSGDKTDILPNQLVSQNDVWKLVETPHDSLRILRYPAIVLSKNGTDNIASVIHDRYTNIIGIKILYYKQPNHFDLMTNTPCELPIDAFDDLVTGAVDLYVQYAAGAEANKRRQDEARRQQAKQNKKDNEDED